METLKISALLLLSFLYSLLPVSQESTLMGKVAEATQREASTPNRNADPRIDI